MSKKTYTVHRAMHADGRDYVRGDEREMDEGDAAEMVASGSLSLKGEEPVTRDPSGVRHTFGQEPTTSFVDDGTDSRVEGREPGVTIARKPAKRTA